MDNSAFFSKSFLSLEAEKSIVIFIFCGQIKAVELKPLERIRLVEIIDWDEIKKANSTFAGFRCNLDWQCLIH